MFAFLPKMYCKFFPYIVSYLAHRRERRHAERETRRRQVRYVRPVLEEFEERIVPDAYTWNGNVSTSWTDGRNWTDTTPIPNTTGKVPGAMDTAFIPGNTTVVLDSTLDQTVAGLTVGGTLSVGTGSNSSKLSVTTLSTPGTFNLGTNGELDVLSSGTFSGDGTLSGRLDVPAVVTFDPNSSMTLAAGVSITGGGGVNIDGAVTCNAAIGPDATINLNNDGISTFGALTGAGSLDEGKDFNWNGGILGLLGGVTLEPSSGFKMQGADKKELSAGTLTSIAQLVDLGGTGTFQVDNGATFNNEAGETKVSLPFIDVLGGSSPGEFINNANGILDIDSAGTTTIEGPFTNTGTLDVADGTDVTLLNMAFASMNLDGTLQLGGDITVIGMVSSPSGLVENAGAGTLRVGNPSAGGGVLNLGQGANIFGNLEVSGNGSLTSGGELFDSGKVKLDSGSTTSLSSYMQSSTGTLEEQASAAGTNSKLTVSGGAQLSGTLEMDFVGGYTPVSGDAFTVVTASSIGAHFDTTPASMTAGYGSTSVTLTQN